MSKRVPPTTDPEPAPARRGPWAVLVCAGLLTIHAVLAVTSLAQKSVTVDEFAHLPAGLSYLKLGSFEIYHHNPPLVKALAAVPVWLAGATLDTNELTVRPERPSQWQFANDFMFVNRARYHLLFCVGRFIIVGLSVLTGIVVFRWARELYGPWAGCTAAALWAFSPTVLAHARLVTTDLGATSAGFIATYLFWTWLRRPTWRRTLGVGVVLGLAQLCKFSMLVLYPLTLLVWIVYRLAAAPARDDDGAAPPRPTLVGQLARLAVMYVLTLPIINLGYLCSGTFTPLGRFDFLSDELTVDAGATPAELASTRDPYVGRLIQRRSRFRNTWLAGLPVPLPYDYVAGYDEQRWETLAGYPVYLNGVFRRRGWWYYYLYAMALKVPLSTLALLVLAGVSAWRFRSPQARWVDEAVVLLPVLVVFAVMSFLTDINLGIRYVLPAFPLLFVLAGRLATPAVLRDRILRVAAGACLAYTIVCCARIHPHYLSYFNELGGGPEHGRFHLVDSNIDWGQDLVLLRKYMNDHGVDKINLAYFGNMWPGVLGINYDMVPPGLSPSLVAQFRESMGGPGAPAWQHFRRQLGPKPGLHAVSVHFLMGMPHKVMMGVKHEAGDRYRVRYFPPVSGAFAYFQHFTPIARAGYSIYIYRLTPSDIASYHRRLGRP